jgi:hypothetical protein
MGNVREAGRVVDDDLEVVIPEPAAPAGRLGRATEHPVAAPVGDASELLVVLVDERARVIVDVADGDPAETVGVPQSAVAGPGKDRIHGRARVTGQGSEAVGTPASVDPGTEDRRDLVGWRQSGRAVRPGAAVLESRPAFRSIAGDPLVGGRPADALGLGSLGDRPAVELDPRHEQLPAEHVETGRTMGHESFLRAWVLNTPNHGAKLSFVNNVSGNHI